jgi:O-antigen ligase
VVFEEFAKGVIAAFLIALLVETFFQLRKLLWVQAASMAAVTVLSVLLHRTDNGRLVGALGGVFENPNDLAINIAVNWPLCVAFLFLARGAFKKTLWILGIFVMLYAVQATYSRSGFLALAVAVALVLLEFGIRGKRAGLIAAAFLAFFLVLAIPSHYRDRLTTIVTLKEDEENGRLMSGGSVGARKELLKESIEATVTHPIFGVGPGNFEVVVGHWHVAHNTYFELGAEAGVPALFLFLLILYRVYRNIQLSRKSQIYAENQEFRILTGALYASFGAYLVGAFFSDTAFELFPYFLMAYTSASYRLAAQSEKVLGSLDPVGRKPLYGQLKGRTKSPGLAWNR